ncbi:MAG: NAD(+) synthase [Cyclobacteriaceae bacterium]
MKRLKLGGATVNQTPLDWQSNTTNIINAIKAAKKENIDILCFPELAITSYSCEDLFLSEWLSEGAWRELLKIREAVTGLTVCVGIPIRIEGWTYNGVCVISDKKILGITLKQNLARDGVHYEPRWFEPWPSGVIKNIVIGGEAVSVGDLLYNHKDVTFGFEICEDAWRKVRPASVLVQRGVDLIFNPSASHFAMEKSPSRENLVMSSSSVYSCVYGYVNALGNEAGRMIYDGDIMFAQGGKLILRARRLSLKAYELRSCTVDFQQPPAKQIKLEEDIESKNEEFAQATCLALFDYLRKSKARGFVLSLSGGADSSCCAVLVAEMIRRAGKQLGWKEFCAAFNIDAKDELEATEKLLICAYQSTENSTEITLNAAKGLAESLGATFYNWSVDEEFHSYSKKIEKAIGRPLSWEKDDIALQNIQARSRSPIIWMLANIKQSLLLTTSNRSEGDVGYTTMDGDTSGSLAPVAGVDKPFILQWLKWAEVNLGYAGLSMVNKLQPTAELRPAGESQTDEKDLMPYDLLVRIEKLAIRDRKSPVEIFNILSEGYDAQRLKGYIQKFFRLWSQNQWKRERLAPSFHLDDINVDPRSWCRFPILSANFAQELAALDRS